jgi:hypothetical protein
MLNEKTFFIFTFLTQNIRLIAQKILPLVWGDSEGVRVIRLARENKKSAQPIKPCAFNIIYTNILSSF